MSSAAPDQPDLGTDPTDEPLRTGVAEVDRVLDSMAGLEVRPMAEHAAVFDAAHEQLRRCLDGTG